MLRHQKNSLYNLEDTAPDAAILRQSCRVRPIWSLDSGSPISSSRLDRAPAGDGHGDGGPAAVRAVQKYYIQKTIKLY